MSNRLESLNSKKPATGKPSLKFKPKVVERRSKEEREKSVKVKQEPEDSKSSGKPPRGGKNQRGGRPGGRGGRKDAYANTHVLSSGLLSTGSVTPGAGNGKSSFGSSGSSRESRTISTLSPTPEFLQNLRLKPQLKKSPESVRSGTPETQSDDDDDNDLTKIDMSKEYKFAEDETTLFPVRAERVVETQDAPPSVSKEQSPVKDEPEFVKESSVKSENIETELQQILDTKADLESKISEPVDILNKEESEKLAEDHEHILQSINTRFNDILLQEKEHSDDKFMLFQLPKLLPNYKVVESKVKPEFSTGEAQLGPEASEVSDPIPIDVDSIPPETTESDKASTSNTAQSTGDSETNKFAAPVSNVTGQIGKLNIHKSGKISLNLGNDINLDLTLGVGSNFLQELILLDYDDSSSSKSDTGSKPNPDNSEPKPKQEDPDEMDQDHSMDENQQNQSKGIVHMLGQVDGKLIATPSIS